MISGSIHVAANGITSFFFMAEEYSSIYIPHPLHPSVCQWTSRLLPCPGSCNQWKLYYSLVDMGWHEELEGSMEPRCHTLCFIPHSSLSVAFCLWVEQNDCIQVHVHIWASVWKHVRVWICIPLYMCWRDDICGSMRVWLQCECTSGLVWVRRGHVWRTGLRTVVGVVIGRYCWGSCWGGTPWLGNPSSNLGSSAYPSCSAITAAPARTEGDQLAFLKLDSLLQRYSQLFPRTPVSEILIIFIEFLLCFQLLTYSNIFNSETSLC